MAAPAKGKTTISQIGGGLALSSSIAGLFLWAPRSTTGFTLPQARRAVEYVAVFIVVTGRMEVRIITALMSAFPLRFAFLNIFGQGFGVGLARCVNILLLFQLSQCVIPRNRWTDFFPFLKPVEPIEGAVSDCSRHGFGLDRWRLF